MGLYIIASYKAAPLLTRLANIFLTAALYMGWYSYCTSSWGRVFPQSDSEYFHGYGIWRIGDNKFLTTNTPSPLILHTDGWLLEWYGAFQAFASLGFMSVNLGYFLLVLTVYVGPCKSNADLLFWNAVINIAGCVSWLVAVILFGVKFKETFGIISIGDPVLHYSFYLAVIVAAFQLVAGILLLLTKRKETTVDSA